ncbi:dienelactone hydrolase family protein [Terricaulis sp.]|uniref:dienelactone hydrolase family protein n=1 Tax=Terricaulis sp. TaxID=2768686 RepID=UPI00378509EA
MRLDTPEGNLVEPSRRSIAATLFFAGYAPAALSACASPVTTPSDELITEDVHITGAGNYNLPAYVARPAGRGRHSAIIVVNEIFGIHDYIKDVCRRFAREGYVAIAPDYFDRAGDPAPLTDINAIRPIVAAATYEQTMGDTQGAANWLNAQSFTNRDIGITGFCWGGAIVWMAAARVSAIKAGVAWYGRLVPPAPDGFGAEQGRPWPVDIAGNLHTPVLGLYAENDRGIPVSTVEQMRAALQAADNPSRSEIIVYPGVQHGFHADYRESYNAEAAADGWTRCLAWFRAHGVA